MSLAQQRLITASVGLTASGLQSIGVFDTISGIEATGAVAKRRSGGMGQLKQSAGLPDYGDVTITRVYERERDHDLSRTLLTRVGKAEMNISDAVLDENGQPYRKARTLIGKLLSVSIPDADSESTDYAMLSLTMSVRSVA